MVSRKEVGTGNDYMVGVLEEGLQDYWEREKELLETFEAMLKSLQNLDDGVFVDLGHASESEEKGEEYIKSLGVGDSNRVSAYPLDERSFYFAQRVGSLEKLLFVQYVAIDLTQFIFKKFGHYWLLEKNKYKDIYSIYMFKKKPSALWYSGGMAILGVDDGNYVKPYRGNDILRLIPYQFSTSSPIPNSPAKLKKIAETLGDIDTFTKRRGADYLSGSQFNFICGNNQKPKQPQAPFSRNMLKADAGWHLQYKTSRHGAINKSEIPKDAIGIQDMGDGLTYTLSRMSISRITEGTVTSYRQDVETQRLDSLVSPYENWSYETECEEYADERKYQRVGLANDKKINWFNEMLKLPSSQKFKTTYGGHPVWSFYPMENNFGRYLDRNKRQKMVRLFIQEPLVFNTPPFTNTRLILVY
jgi:hypothetical protein